MEKRERLRGKKGGFIFLMFACGCLMIFFRSLPQEAGSDYSLIKCGVCLAAAILCGGNSIRNFLQADK